MLKVVVNSESQFNLTQPMAKVPQEAPNKIIKTAQATISGLSDAKRKEFPHASLTKPAEKKNKVESLAVNSLSTSSVQCPLSSSASSIPSLSNSPVARNIALGKQILASGGVLLRAHQYFKKALSHTDKSLKNDELGQCFYDLAVAFQTGAYENPYAARKNFQIAVSLGNKNAEIALKALNDQKRTRTKLLALHNKNKSLQLKYCFTSRGYDKEIWIFTLLTEGQIYAELASLDPHDEKSKDQVLRKLGVAIAGGSLEGSCILGSFYEKQNTIDAAKLALYHYKNAADKRFPGALEAFQNLARTINPQREQEIRSLIAEKKQGIESLPQEDQAASTLEMADLYEQIATLKKESGEENLREINAALGYYRKAAELGSTMAKRVLAVHFDKEWNIHKESHILKNEALKYYQLLAQLGDSQARKAIDRLNKHVNK